MSFFENFRAFLAGAASAGMTAARETLIPSLAEGSKAAAEKTGHAVSAASDFSKENLGRAFVGAGQAVHSSARSHVGPAVGGAAVALGRIFEEKVAATMMMIAAWISRILSSWMGGCQYIKGVLGETLWFALLSYSYWFSVLVGKFLLNVVGWTLLGPRGGSIAALLQSWLGNIVASSWFATFQSAAMGGWGTWYTNIIVKALAVVSGAMGEFFGLTNAFSSASDFVHWFSGSANATQTVL